MMVEAVLYYYSRILSYAVAVCQELKEVIYLKDLIAAQYEEEVREKQSLQGELYDAKALLSTEKNVLVQWSQRSSWVPFERKQLRDYLARKCSALERVNQESVANEVERFREISLLKQRNEALSKEVKEASEKAKSINEKNRVLIKEIGNLEARIHQQETEKLKLMNGAIDMKIMFENFNKGFLEEGISQ